MVIHFSILGVILFVGLIWENRVSEQAEFCIRNGQEYSTPILPWLIIFGYIAFLAAMRTNANDTSAYIQSFQNLSPTWEAFQYQLSFVGVGKDWAFDAVGILFKMYVSQDYHMWFAAFAIVEAVIFIHILRRTSASLLICCFYLFSSTLYYNFFSMMRQWFAVSLVFAAFPLVRERKFLKYVLICVIAAQFHNSAYLMIPVYFIVSGMAWSGKQTALIVIFSFFMIFLTPILNTMESSLAGTTYDYAISAMNSSSGSSGIRALIALVPVAIAYMDRYEIEDETMNICVNMSLLNLLLNIVATFTSGLYIIRLATYFGVYNLVLYPYLLRISIKEQWKQLVTILFYIIYFLFYIYQMMHQGAFGYGSDILGYFY